MVVVDVVVVDSAERGIVADTDCARFLECEK